MLVLSRRNNEKILLPSINTVIQLVSTKPGVARIGIDAPDSVPVFREEIFDRVQWEATAKQACVVSDEEYHQLVHGLRNRLNSATIGLALLRRQLDAGRLDSLHGTLDKIDHEISLLNQHLEQQQPSEAPTKVRTGGRRALLVEDNSNECELLAGFLRMAGLEVDTAGDGSDALEYLQCHEKPDVVLLDMMLPRTDGPTTVKAIRQNPRLKGVKIFGVSGGVRERFPVKTGPDGIDAWFGKPLNPEMLLRELNNPALTQSA